MAGYELSRTGRSEHPFFVDQAGINLYSVEELLYLVCRYPSLLEGPLRSEALIRWLSEEFGLAHVGYAMKRGIGETADPTLFILPLLREYAYLDSTELKRYMNRLHALQFAEEAVRLKMRGEDLAAMRKYSAALALFEEAEKLCARSERALRAGIYCDVADVQMQLLNWPEGTRRYAEAYRLHPTDRHLMRYLLALKLTVPKERFEEKTEELGVSEELKAEVQRRIEEVYGEELPLPEDLHEALVSYRSAWHAERG